VGFVKKCEYVLTLKNEQGVTVFEIKNRKSKVIKAFLEKALKEKWIIKSEAFEIIKNTFQFNNIWEYFEAIKKEGVKE
jgi:hypothetical protein